jgi:hypothetical protein
MENSQVVTALKPWADYRGKYICYLYMIIYEIGMKGDFFTTK